MIHILETVDQRQVRRIMRDIRVDPYGIAIMAPKAISHLLRINSLSNVAANILKQEMLALGGDAAIARGALTGQSKKTDCLVMGNISQFNRLKEKLNRQPFGLDKLSRDLFCALDNYQKDSFVLKLGGYNLRLGARTHIMGIVNLTPDSFSGDGLYASHAALLRGRPLTRAGTPHVIEFVENIVSDGADIIDVGGESSRPGAKPVSLKEELSRVIPVIKILAKKIKAPISIDTYKPQVARIALDNGAVMVNDITGLRDIGMARLVAKKKCAVVIMHMKGKPRTMQNNPVYASLIEEIIRYLDNALQRAVNAGVGRDKIIIDPGIGFGKTLQHNLEILRKLKEFKVLGRPILVGVSRKSFIGRILDAGPQDRIFGSISACLCAAENGASILRAHDVKEVKQAIEILDRVKNR